MTLIFEAFFFSIQHAKSVWKRGCGIFTVSLIGTLLCEISLGCLMSLIVMSENFIYANNTIISRDFAVLVFHNTLIKRGISHDIFPPSHLLLSLLFSFFLLYNLKATFHLFPILKIKLTKSGHPHLWNVHTISGLVITLSKALIPH